MGMNDAAQLYRIQEKVSFYENCFHACLAGMILFCCLAVFLCIYFNIPSIIEERLGIKRKRTLSQMGNAISEKLPAYKLREIDDSDRGYDSRDTTMETSSEKTMLLTEEPFVMEKDIVLSEARSRQKKSED